jgi:hypothetical protein
MSASDSFSSFPSFKSKVLENIQAAAHDNARFIRPWRSVEERDDDDNITIQQDAIIIQKRNSNRKYDVYSTRPRNPDIAKRVLGTCDYFSEVVLTTCDDIDVSGVYRVCYDDSIDDPSETNYLVYSKFVGQTVACMPDLYYQSNFSGRGIYMNDTTPFEKKKPKAVFAGGSTGTNDVLKNTRIQGCLWSLAGNRDISRFVISNIVQITPDDLVNALTLPIATSIVQDAIYTNEQMEYQCIASIDGNTSAWDRPIWIMGTRSILLKKSSNCMCWYYPYMKAGRHFVDINEWKDVRTAVEYYNSNPKERWLMTEEAQEFLKDYIDVPAGVAYTKALLERACDLYKP